MRCLRRVAWATTLLLVLSLSVFSAPMPDGNVAPLGSRDDIVNVGDALVCLRFALGLETPSSEDFIHADVAPLDSNNLPNPDGVINVGDALVILRKAVGLVDFPGAPGANPDPYNYMPFVPGRAWVYRGTLTETGSPPISYTNILSIEGTHSVDGRVTTVFRESNPENAGLAEDTYHYKDLNGISFFGSSDQDPFLAQLIPYQEIKFPLVTGSSFVQLNKTGLNYGEDLDADGINEKVSVSAIVYVRGFETVTVPAGTFSNSLKIETTITIDVTLSINRRTYRFTGVETRWFAADVGPIKKVSVFNAFDGTSETIVEELTGRFSLLASNLAPASSDTESPGKPSIGFDGTNFLIVTRKETSAFNSSMLGVLFSHDGKIIKSFDVAAADTGGTLSSNRSDVAFDGKNYLVVFGRNGQIAAQRVTPAGQILDGPSGFVIASGGSNYQPVVAFDGTNYLVVWGQFQSDYDISGALVSQEGQVLREFSVFAAPGQQSSPAIVFDGSNYLVAWRDGRWNGFEEEVNIYATRVTPAGQPLNPMGIPVCTAPGYQDQPALAFDGQNYFAVWADGRAFAGYSGQIPGLDIFGTRIAVDGSVLDGAGIAINNRRYMDYNGKANPSVVFDQDKYLVSWQTGSYADFPPAGIFAARVTTTGQVLGDVVLGDGLPVSGPPPSFSRYVYPVTKYGGMSSLIVWINVSELYGTSKDLRAAFVPVQ